MLKAVAIDDEPVALDVIQSLAAKISFVQVAACFTNAFEALPYLQQQKVDLLFLDIKMPDISGIDFLKAIPNPPMVIFTTAYSEHAVQSFELDAIDYLLKPFSQARFLKACTKAYEQYLLKNPETTPSFIFIKTGTEQVKVSFDEIMYVESSGNYMQFICAGKKITSRLTMGEAETLLPAAEFVRIHRSYIVSKSQVTKIDRNTVWVQQTALPIGSAYVNEVVKMIQ
ncbi:MAG TPA: LytTR family DNA-binding domain-containing protein [Chitinophagaceae bacterium]|nr:LytTR family DNA-binding domain-containing protein [Chitinophagaceae bacterium]